MKKIFFSIFILLTAIVTMAYLYFSKLNADQAQDDNSLYAAAAGSSLIFSFENDKRVTDILKSQELFKNIVGERTFLRLKSLREQLLETAGMSALLHKQTTYFSIHPGKGNDLNYIFCTQISPEFENADILNAIKHEVLQVDSADHVTRLTLKDSTTFYLAIQERLLLISDAPQPLNGVLVSLKEKKENTFVDYIKSNSSLTRNTLAQLYVDFNSIPGILKPMIKGKLSGPLSVLDHQKTYAAFTYNYSNDKLLFTGTTAINDQHSYYQLYAEMKSVKVSINSIFPDLTANYSIFAIDNYPAFRQKLTKWFEQGKDQKKVSSILQNISSQYHLDPELLFPRYFKDQFAVFQLSTSEQLGAISLSNGDKLNQLLIDLTDDYNEDIKHLKTPDLLYAYFGLPLAQFRTPYYTIKDNVMVFANSAATMEIFLRRYNDNLLLTSSLSYSSALNQLPDRFNISFYVDQQQSLPLFKRNISQDYQAPFSAGKFDAFSYQLSGDQGKFQTNMLFNKQSTLEKDSLLLQ
ncbi:hypothetical protein PBAL39_24840 [Pedobacter sp. BAL39]|uniref:hypothetical protein n=1 Tax=Pedobacter sp. BAL39 TaxID=391596 RepID=UPI0001559E09|nr:hypothetical protein [Pedobacter sp. BAL39]EDM36554.1 hypothetical protein PBAL39_24840 [Pedobacter sp. BAL39]